MIIVRNFTDAQQVKQLNIGDDLWDLEEIKKYSQSEEQWQFDRVVWAQRKIDGRTLAYRSNNSYDFYYHMIRELVSYHHETGSNGILDRVDELVGQALEAIHFHHPEYDPTGYITYQFGWELFLDECRKETTAKEIEIMRHRRDYLLDEDRYEEEPTNFYLIREGSDGNIKIGKALIPFRRLQELQTSNSNDLELIYVARECDYFNEKSLHKKFENQRIRGEWFKPKLLLEELDWFRMLEELPL